MYVRVDLFNEKHQRYRVTEDQLSLFSLRQLFGCWTTSSLQNLMFGNIVTENVIPARAADTPDLAQGTNGNAVGVSDTIITTGFIKNIMSAPRTVICLLRNDLRLIDNEVRPSVSHTKEFGTCPCIYKTLFHRNTN